MVVGHQCTYKGRLPETARVEKVANWGPCLDISDVCAFLGTIRVCHMFIRNFTHRANPLTILTRKNQPFIFRPEQVAAQEDLKQALFDSPALRPIDYSSGSPVILGVDTSYLAVSYLLSQCDTLDP